LQVDSHGRLLVDNQSTNDTNYGTVGANTLRTAAQIGNASGAADFNAGATTAQTLRVAANLYDGSGNALSSTSGALNVSSAQSGTWNIGTVTSITNPVAVTQSTSPWVVSGTVAVTQSTSPWVVSGTVTAVLSYDENWGTVGSNTLRTAAEIGNANGAADFNNGATGAQTLRVAANQGAPNTAANAWPISITSGGSLNSPTNPIFVSSSDVAGNSVDNYQTSASLAAGSSVSLDYTVSAGKTFYTRQFWAAGSGKIKLQCEYETAAASGIFNTFWVGFNSTADTNILIPVPSAKTQVTGARIRMVISNLDLAAQDVYSTLSGTEQ
jgi:hypothetical protein